MINIKNFICKKVDFWENAGLIINKFHKGGVFCTVSDKKGNTNVLTLSWGQIGPFYNGNPVCIIAVTPLRYSWRFLEESDDFTIGVSGEELGKALKFCGMKSGRDFDKFSKCGLIKVKSQIVSAPSIEQCQINIECRIYERVHPPHMLLTPNHRKRLVVEQHTIYFAQVLGAWDRSLVCRFLIHFFDQILQENGEYLDI